MRSLVLSLFVPFTVSGAFPAISSRAALLWPKARSQAFLSLARHGEQPASRCIGKRGPANFRCFASFFFSPPLALPPAERRFSRDGRRRCFSSSSSATARSATCHFIFTSAPAIFGRSRKPASPFSGSWQPRPWWRSLARPANLFLRLKTKNVGRATAAEKNAPSGEQSRDF